MDQAENAGLRREFAESIDTVVKLSHVVAFEVLRSHVENVNQNLNVFKNVFPLALEELFHEKVLTSTIPQGKN